MANTREEIREGRRRLKAQYADLFDSVSALLFRSDPIGINFEENTDEYENEVGTILPRLETCQSAEDVLHVVHQEFVRWFDAGIAGPQSRYTETAVEIWRLWNEHKSLKGS